MILSKESSSSSALLPKGIGKQAFKSYLSKMDNVSPTYFLDYKHPTVQQLVLEFQSGASTKEKAIALYRKVRDGWRYNPYRISLDKEAYRASAIATKKEGHCIEKAILLVAALRALEIPSRLHLAKVKNHIGVERLVEKFGTNELTPHGMVDLFLDSKWLKISPAFNKELCHLCHVDPLEFDGEHDSVFQQFDRRGNAFMQYLEDYGSFDDVPIGFIFKNFKEHYPQIQKKFKGEREINL